MHDSFGSNPLILGVIGIPIILGFYFRFFRFNGAALATNIKVSLVVYLTIAVGYSRVRFDNPNQFFLDNCVLILQITIVLLTVVFIILANIEKNVDYSVFLVVLASIILVFMLHNFINGVVTNYFIPFSVIVVFCSFGVLNAILGSILAGFTISSSIYSYLLTGSVENIFIWKEVFEFFEISSNPIKILILFGTALAGSYEMIVNYFQE